MATPIRPRAGKAGSEREGRNAPRGAVRAVTPQINGTERPGAGATHGTEARARGRGGETIEQCMLRTLDQYFADLDGAKPHALHEMVMQAVERPLLLFAMERCAGNQSAAAELLGINRNTLRKKLQEHKLA
jgi:Fis family transcriptional regulator